MNLTPRDNFYRCMTLIVDNGNEAAWELLDFHLSKQGTTLKAFIENNQHEIYHLHYNYGRCCRCKYKTVKKPKRRILCEAQLDILLDTKGKNIPCNLPTKSCTHTINDHYANANIATNQLDLTLCRCLLINFTNILPSASVERNSFENLITMRNKCCHASKGEIASQDYQAYKGQIEQCLLALAKIYGKTPEMTLKIKDAEKRPFDESIYKQLQHNEQILQSVSEHTTIEIQKLGKCTKRTLQTAKLCLKSTGNTASKIQKIEKSSKKTIMVVKSIKRSIESKLKVDTERTMHAIDSIREEEKSTATKIQKIDERLSKCETSKKSRLIGLTQTEIDGHLTKGTFVETPAVQACIKLLDTNSILILTGAAGTGKSRNSLEILHQFRVKHPEYKVVKLTDLHDFTDFVLDEEKLVILFEDIFGRTNTRFAENTDVQIIDRLHACTIKGSIKVILTVRDTIRISCEWILNSHELFHRKCEVDLSSDEYKMTKFEKEKLLLKYFVANNFRLLDLNDSENYNEEAILDPQITVTVNQVTLHNIVESEPLLGFPEACSLFTGNRKLTRLGLSFFKHPSKYLFEEIEKLRINGKYNEPDRMSYLTLVYILLNEDVLDPDDMKLNICLEILETCFGISNKNLPVCHIIDAAKEMTGRYLIFHFDDSTYHLQHQTIFESILISYNGVDPGIILSRLSFDFIREMVRLHKYKPREGEIVMKITSRYYSLLANRIIEIIQSEYFNKSLSLNVQLLCESQIIRENDEVFFKHFIEKAHHAYFQPDYDLQTFVTYSGECKLCQLYLPALLLERITQQKKMNKSITILIDHITQMLHSESDEDIEFVCNSSLLEAFLHVCELENNENILEHIWVPIKSLDMSRIKEYIRNSINGLCSRCPITTIKWIVNNIDRSTIDINQILNTACEFKRLGVVQFLCTTVLEEKRHGVSIHDNMFLHTLDKSQCKETAVNHLDFTAAFIAAINNVWNDRDEPVSKWLIENVPHQLFDMKKVTMKVLDMKCMEDLKFLIKNVDNCMLDMKLAYTTQYKEGRKSIENLLRWMAENVEQQKIDIPELNNLPCMVKDIEVVKYLFNIFDPSLLDWTAILMSAVNSDWGGKNKYLIEWLISNVDLKYFEFTKVIQEVHETNEHLLRLLLEKVNSALLDIKQVLNQACRFSWIDVVTWTLHNINHALLAFKEPINIVFNSWKNDNEDGKDMEDKINQKPNKKEQLIKLFLENVNHDSLDLKEILNQACRCCSLDVIMFVFENTDHKRLDVTKAMNIVYNLWIYDNNDENDVNEEDEAITDRRDKYEPLIKLFLEKVNHDSLELREILNQACRYGSLDVVTLVLENTEHKKLELMEAVNIAYRSLRDVGGNDNMRQKYEPLIKLILAKVNRESLDLKKVLNQACRYGCLDIVTFVLENIDHEKLDVNEAMSIAYSLLGDNEDDDNIRQKYEPLINLILEKVNHESLDLKKVLNQACRYGHLDIVTLVLENTDHEQLDVMQAVNRVYSSKWVYYYDVNNQRKKYETLIKLILEKVNHESLDLEKVFNQACRFSYLDVVSSMLENIDHEKLDLNEAMNMTYDQCGNHILGWKKQQYELLLKLILEKVNHDSLALKKVLNQACRYGCLDIVTFVLDNIEHEKLDVNKAMNIAYSSLVDDEDDDDIRQKYEPLIRLILEKVNHESLDLKKVFNQACRIGYLDVIQLMLQNIDHEKLDLDEAMQMAYDQHDNNISGRKKQKYEPVVKLILEKVNHAALDLQKILNQACRNGCLDIVTLVLENIHHEKLDFNEAISIAYSSLEDNEDDDNIRQMYEPLIKTILEKVNRESLDLKKVLNQACRYGHLDIVMFVLENTEQEQLDVTEEVNRLYSSKWVCYNDNYHRKKYETLIKLILEKVNHELLDLKKLFNQACGFCYLDVVSSMLENIDHEKFDLNESMNMTYDQRENHILGWKQKCEPVIKLILKKVNHDVLDLKKVLNQACRYGRLDIVTFVLEIIDHEKLDVNEAMNIAYSSMEEDNEANDNIRKRYEPLIELILRKVNHDSLDLKKVFNQACRYGCLDIVTFMFENINYEKFDVNEAMSTVNSSKRVYHYGFNNQRKKYDALIKLILGRVNHDTLDFREMLYQACYYGCLEVVTFVLENIDHNKLDIMKAVQMLYSSLRDNYGGNYNNRKQKELLIRLVLEKVNYDLLDMEKVFEQACCYQCIDVVTFLLDKTDLEKLNIMKAVQLLYSSVKENYDDIDNLRTKYEHLFKLILEKVNNDLLDFKNIMTTASCYGCLDVVTFVLENTDHTKLGIMEALNAVYIGNYGDDINDQRKKYVSLIKLIIEEVNHDLLDLKQVFSQACCYGCLDAVTFLLENTDHKKLDVMKAVYTPYGQIWDEDDIEQREKKVPLIKMILETVDHDLLVLKEIMNEACCYGYLGVVTFLLENTNHEKLDIMEAVNNAFSSISGEDDDEDDIEERENMESLIELILEKADHDLLVLKEIMDKACRYGCLGVVTLLLENTNHEKLDIMEAVNNAFSSISGEDDDEDDIEEREKKESLIKLILENADHDLLVLKEIMDKACRYGCLDVVTFLLENTNHEKLNIMEAVNKACNPSIDGETDNNMCDNSSNEKLIKMFLQKVKTGILDMEILMNEACRNGWLNIVRWLVEYIDHSMFDVDIAINLFILYDSDGTLDIFKLLLQNISPDLFAIGTVIEQASRLNHTEKVLWLLQNKDSSLFEMKYVMNEACRNSNLQIMKYVIENMDKDCFDVRSAMNKACRSSKPNSLEAVKWLLENVPHDMLDLESAMNNACRYDLVAVVKWFWTTLDRKLFNVKTAWNNACYNCNEALLSYLINTMNEKMLDKSKAMSQACLNYQEGDKVISLLFEQPNMNTQENCKKVLKEACVHSNRPIVEWMLENTDVQTSELKVTLIDTIKATINKSNDKEKSDHESLVWLMLLHHKIQKLDRNDLSDVMEAVCSIGQLDMVKRLLHTTEQSMFNMRAIVNTACESGKFEIVDWFLQNIELTNIDVQTVMEESCGYGWLEIVKLLWSKFDKENFDMRTSMDEACSYGRYEIVEFLLENVDSNLLDTKLVLEKSCGYGWKDIILWLFDNIDNISIDSKACMLEACAQGRLEIFELFWSKYGTNNFDVDILIGISCKNSGNRGVMKFLIENFDLTQSHMDIIVKNACKYGWTEIVISILDRCKHNKNLMEEAMKYACNSGETEIVKILLDNVDVGFIEIKNAMIISCQKGWDELVSLLLEGVNHSLFDFTVAMNEACRFGEADIVELFIQKIDHKFFNFENAIMEACKSHLNENLVLILLKYINRSTSDMEAVSGKAYDNGWRRVSSRLKRMICND